jgi:uncharacterized protein YwqG
MVQYADSERRILLGYAAAPTLDRNLVARYALGERGLAESILAPFRSERFGRIWNNLGALAEPALGIEARKGSPTGRSKLGGLPHLPERVDWPRRGQKPLIFIAQLDLDEVSGHLRDPALPPTGLLSFFYEADQWTSGDSPADSGAWRVLLLDEPAAPRLPPPQSAPAALEGYDPANWGFEEAGVAFVPRISLPEAEHLMVERLGVGGDDYEAYGALMDELRQAHALDGVTQLLGYPAEIQHDPFITCQLVANGVDTLTIEDWRAENITRLVETRESWRLLLQVDSISAIGMEWADSGLLYFSMRDGDLRTRQWDNSWLVMESL